MQSRDEYIAIQEMNVKNLLSNIYSFEYIVLQKMSHKNALREELLQELNALDHKGKMLTIQFEKLRTSKSGMWEDMLTDYEQVLHSIGNEKEGFFSQITTYINELSLEIERLTRIYERRGNFPKRNLEDRIEALNARKFLILEKSEYFKYSDGEIWREFKDWFVQWKNTEHS